jgi:hexosaminidase
MTAARLRGKHPLPLIFLLALAWLPTAGAQSAGDTQERTGGAHAAASPVELPVIPRPASFTLTGGTCTLGAGGAIVIGTSTPRVREIADDLAAQLGEAGLRMKTATRASGGTDIVLRLVSAPGANPERYTLRATATGVEIEAPDAAGLYAGTQTLRQLVLAATAERAGTPGTATIACVVIDDAPRFGWRGLLLDCARHFMRVDYVKRTIDRIALHRMNRLHWHLTDDQAWRIAIDKHPKLVAVGSTRRGPDGSVHEGFYTKAEIREIVEYARRRNVTVVPEIEMPGHAQAALAAYPEYSCTGGPHTVATTWGVFKEIYCAGNDATFTFLEGVLGEVLALFPSPWIHIGGDEAPKYRWERCAKCQARITSEKLAGEAELQSWFIARIGRFLAARGRRLIGWDEILEGGLAPNAIVQSWRGMEGAREAAVARHDAIVSPTSHAYFDYDVRSISLEKVYQFEPVPEGLTDDESRHILGGECNLWTEYAPEDRADSRIWPRLLAMAEVLWTPAPQRDWRDFHARVQAHYPVLDRLGITYGYEAPPVRFVPQVVHDAATVEVSVLPGQPTLDVACTIDGSDPARTRTGCASPLAITAPTTIRAVALRRGGARGGTPGEEHTLRVEPHAALGDAVQLTHAYSPWYTGGGDNALTDGVRGSEDFRDGHWQGFEHPVFEAAIDLGAERPITRIELGCLQFMPAWIFMPDSVEFQISNSGTDWQTVGVVRHTIPPQSDARILHTFVCEAGARRARHVRVVARSVGTCPDWHPGAGGATWIFADELIVR